MLFSLGFGLLNGCTEPHSQSLFDPGETGRPAPEITGILPAGTAVAGMDTVILQGNNFSSTASNNIVYFNAEPASLINASPTQLSLIAPLALGDSITVRMTVHGSIDFSNRMIYALIAGVDSFGVLAPATPLTPAEITTSMTVDVSGNLYAAFTLAGSDGGVLQFTPDEIRSTYAPATSGVASWTGLKFGTGGYLYAARNFRAIYRFSPGGGASSAVWLVFPVGIKIVDFDFDQNGILWCGSETGEVYRIQPDKSYTTIPFAGPMTSIRVFGGYLYWSVTEAGGGKVWRAKINATSLDTPEVYFDLGAAIPGASPYSITFSADGMLFIGTAPPNGLVQVALDGSWSAPYVAYTALFGTGIKSLAWGGSEEMYAGTIDGAIVRFLVRGKSTAPYFGTTQ